MLCQLFSLTYDLNFIEIKMEEKKSESNKTTKWQKVKEKVKKNLKYIKFTFLIVKELLDCSLDWVLYDKLNSVEKGLVVGPVDIWALGSLLVFCCLGTLVSVFDIGNRLYDLRTGTALVNIGITETCVMYFEDIPQLTISFVTLLCRGANEGLHELAIAKAIFISSALFVNSLLTEGERKKVDEVPENKEIKCRTLNLLGSVVIGSVILFLSVVKLIGFRSHGPHDDISTRYFSNIGIYSDTTRIPLKGEFGTVSWMKYFDLNDIVSCREITTQVTIDPSHIRIHTFYSGMCGNTTDICYVLSDANHTYFTNASDCMVSNGTMLHYIFKYLSPSKRHPFGNVQYNVRRTSIGSCEDIGYKSVQHLKYYGAKDTQNATGHLRVLSFEKERQYRFYSAEEDLVDINNIWRTGIERLRCETTGSVSPQLNTDISVPCVV